MGQTRQVLAGSHLAVVKSGTVTLEAAYFGVPMVIYYHAARAMGLVRGLAPAWAVRTTHLSLVNILAGRALVPELMPWYGSVNQLWQALVEQMEDLGGMLQTRAALLDLTDSLRAAPSTGGRSGTASDRAAQLVAGLIRQ